MRRIHVSISCEIGDGVAGFSEVQGKLGAVWAARLKSETWILQLQSPQPWLWTSCFPGKEANPRSSAFCSSRSCTWTLSAYDATDPKKVRENDLDWLLAFGNFCFDMFSFFGGRPSMELPLITLWRFSVRGLSGFLWPHGKTLTYPTRGPRDPRWTPRPRPSAPGEAEVVCASVI